ncbi:MAG: DUF1858 domain-containing protein [Deltaproteobacteria bacterium]|nr:MAG: DUF1858 domain-containing protein [Deltaproteobacteria bacterium]
MARKDGPVKPDMILFDVAKNYPETRKKIAELFGKKCLSCPSAKKETVAYTAFHKGYDPDQVVRELNSVIGKGSRGRS